jgi:hypothetical protein
MFTAPVRCVRLAKKSAVALVGAEDEAMGTGSHCALTLATWEMVAETVGRLRKMPAPAVPAPSKTERPLRSSGANEAERVRAMLLNLWILESVCRF